VGKSERSVKGFMEVGACGRVIISEVEANEPEVGGVRKDQRETKKNGHS